MRLLAHFLRRYVRRYARYYVLGVLALVLTNAIAVWIPREIQAAVDALKAGQREAVTGAVLRIVGLAAGLILIRTASRVLFFNPGRAIERDLRNDLFAHYLSRPESWFRGRSTGDLLSRATNDVLSVRALVGFAFLQMVNMVLLLSMVASQMLSISIRVTLLSAVPMALGLLVLRVAIRRLLAWNRRSQERLAELEQQVLEGLKGVRVMRDFGAAPLLLRGFDRRNEELLELRLRISKIASFLLPVVRVVGHLAIGLLLIWSSRAAGAERLGVGELAAYIAYLSMLVAVLFSLGWMLNAWQRGIVSLQRVHEVMPLDEARPAARAEREAEADGPDPLSGRGPVGIETRDLCFSRGGRVVIDGIHLRASPGTHLGILGTVGSGKSTLAALLAGMEVPEGGEIRLGGLPMEKLPIHSIRRRVRVVPDVPFLFTRSLRENVGFVDRPKEIDPERVRKALEVASFDPEAEGLRDGAKTLVGEKGITLSGGQKQRLTLARAIYAGAEVLILDDVLSAVDHRTEQTILDRLSRWRRHEGRNVALINISNRVSAIEDADEIVVLHQGRIVERGRPEELRQADGLYARTRELQEAIERRRPPERRSMAGAAPAGEEP